MKTTRLWMLAAVLACAACGQETPPAATTQAEAPAPTAPAGEAPPAEAVPKPEPGQTDGETVDTSVSATSPIVAALDATTPAPPSGDLANWKAGENFIAYPVA